MTFEEQIRMESEMDWGEQIYEQRQLQKSIGGIEPSLNLGTMLVKQGGEVNIDEALLTLEKLFPKIATRISKNCSDKLRIPSNSLSDVDDKADAQLLQCLYFISLSNYKQKSFKKCIASCDKLLRLLPTHHQATDLKSLAEIGLKTEQTDDIKLTTGLILTSLGAVGLGLLLSRSKK